MEYTYEHLYKMVMVRLQNDFEYYDERHHELLMENSQDTDKIDLHRTISIYLACLLDGLRSMTTENA